MSRWDFVPYLAALTSAAFFISSVGCSTPDGSTFRTDAITFGEKHGFSELAIESQPFQLLVLAKLQQPSPHLIVYLEGDGASWPTPYAPPRDPSPREPLVLELASIDTSPAVAYIGRPCQYLADKDRAHCSPSYWLGERFSPEVISAYDQLLSILKAKASTQRLILIGYSGGGVLAALLAERRNDVSFWATIASPLALAEWVKLQEITAMEGSIDPWDGKGTLPPSIHWSGGEDKIVPSIVVEKFVLRRGGRHVVISNFGHDCCWTRDWSNLRKVLPQ